MIGKQILMKRLFFALLPDDETRRQCVEVQHLLAKYGCQPVAASNLHVTLVFLGQVNRLTEQAISEGAGKLVVPKVQIVFDQLTYWHKPRIVCLTAQNAPENNLSKLVQQLTAEATKLAMPVEERPYVPHVTLARKAKQILAINFKPIQWRADSFCLMESCSLPTGVEYRVCQRWG